jgi:hypothetical protein
MRTDPDEEDAGRGRCISPDGPRRSALRYERRGDGQSRPANKLVAAANTRAQTGLLRPTDDSVDMGRWFASQGSDDLPLERRHRGRPAWSVLRRCVFGGAEARAWRRSNESRPSAGHQHRHSERSGTDVQEPHSTTRLRWCPGVKGPAADVNPSRLSELPSATPLGAATGRVSSQGRGLSKGAGMMGACCSGSSPSDSVLGHEAAWPARVPAGVAWNRFQ